MPPHMTRTGQWMFTIKLLDQRLQEAAHRSEGVRVRFFKDDESNLPQIREHGDVVLLRNVKVLSVNGQSMLVSGYQTRTQVFPAASIPAPSFSIAYQGTSRLQSLGAPADIERLSLAEQAHVIALKSEVRLPDAGPARGAAEGLGRKRDLPPEIYPGPPEKKAR
ncbi:hypothetical protein LTR53_019308, partial [Teratosphaeriaceae sp. CCFEE 6253]